MTTTRKEEEYDECVICHKKTTHKENDTINDRDIACNEAGTVCGECVQIHKQ